MTRTSLTVSQGTLGNATVSDPGIAVGSPDWYAWLNQATTFSFVSQGGTFTARKQQFQRGGWYWKAYRKQGGKLRCAYLGKSEHLSLERLHAIAQVLSQRGGTPAASAPEEPPLDLAKAQAEGGASARSRPQRPDTNVQLTPALLALRTTIPPVPVGLVSRARLIEQLNTLSRRKLTLLLAPAGWGKTTLLSAWSALCPSSVAWLTLEKSENEPTRFWKALFVALSHLETRLGRRILTLLGHVHAHESSILLTSLLQELHAFQYHMIFVLDDYHLITHPTIHQELAFFVEHLPSSCHLVLSSRIRPPLPLARLLVRNGIGEMSAADLRFTLEEIADFFRQVHNLELATTHLATLETWSEGWIAILHLTGLAAQQERDAGSFLARVTGAHRSILAYLREEIIEQQSAKVQAFLLAISPLRGFNGSLCQVVTEVLEASELIEELEEANLLMLQQDGWYRLPRPLAEALHHILQRAEPERLSLLHLRASHWYEKHGFSQDAIQEAIQGSALERAAALIEGIAPILVEQGDLVTLGAWLALLPYDTIQGSPRLCLSMAWSLLLTAQIETFASWVNAAEQALSLGEDNQPASTSTLHDEIAALRALLLLTHNDCAPAITLCEQLLQPHPGESNHSRALALLNIGMATSRNNMNRTTQAFAQANYSLIMSDHPLLRLTLLANQAGLYLAQGQPFRAEALYQQMLVQAGKPHGYPFFAEGLAHLGLGYLSWEWNDLAMARHHFLQAWDMGKQIEAVQVMAVNSACFLTQIAQAERDTAAAEEWLRQIEILAQRIHCRELLEQVAICRTRYWLARGYRDEALIWLSEQRWSSVQEESVQGEYMMLTRVRVLLASSQTSQDTTSAQQARALLARCYRNAEKGERSRSLIEIQVLQALACFFQNDQADALTALEQAIRLAEPGRYVRLFVNEGEPMAELLRLLLGQRKSRTTLAEIPSTVYLRSLLKACTHPASAPLSITSTYHQALLDPLSQREREVLWLLAAGRKNQEIADELVVVIGTVKAHIQSIYRKLAVNSRVQAVARARALQIL